MEKQIIDNNVLMADFIGIGRIQTAGKGCLYNVDGFELLPLNVHLKVGNPEMGVSTRLLKYWPEQLIFHSSWDWLHIVLDNIEQMFYDALTEGWDEFTDWFYNQNFSYIKFDNGDLLVKLNIGGAHDEAATIIKWYNENKKQN
jgi:hypothetical protein